MKLKNKIQDLEKIIPYIKNGLISEFSNQYWKDNLLSLTFVGSTETNIAPNLKGDIDGILLLNEITKSNYQEITISIERLINKAYQEFNLDPKKTYLFQNHKIGPLKNYQEESVTSIDLSILTRDIFLNKYLKLSPLTSYSFAQHEASIGENIGDLFDIRKPTKDQILNSTVGINDRINMIHTKEIPYIQWEDTEEGFKLKRSTTKIKEGEYCFLDVCFSSAIKSIDNALLIIEDEEKIKSFLEQKEIFMNSRIKIRNEEIHLNEINPVETKETVLDFLNKLKDYLGDT